MVEIIVTNPVTRVHSFDIYGVVCDSLALSEAAMAKYLDWARTSDIEPGLAANAVHEYRALCRGEDWAVARKPEIIDALAGPIKEQPTDYTPTFYEDCMQLFRMIREARHGVLIFGTRLNPGLVEQLPDGLGDVVVAEYQGDKSNPGVWVEVWEQERAHGRAILTHTEDELPGLVGAMRSGLVPPDGLIYANRNNAKTRAQVNAAGIKQYVADLRDAKIIFM